MPAPTDVAMVKGTDMKDPSIEIDREMSDDAPFAALAFKVMTDPFVGKLTFFRVYAGIVEKGSYVLNSTKGKKREWEEFFKCTLTKEKKSMQLLWRYRCSSRIKRNYYWRHSMC